jgi:hypothetical protein
MLAVPRRASIKNTFRTTPLPLSQRRKKQHNLQIPQKMKPQPPPLSHVLIDADYCISGVFYPPDFNGSISSCITTSSNSWEGDFSTPPLPIVVESASFLRPTLPPPSLNWKNRPNYRHKTIENTSTWHLGSTYTSGEDDVGNNT